MNLFDVTASIEHPLGSKPRAANDSEVSAYMRWQRERRGLPDLEGMELEWRAYPGSRGQRICVGATFGKIVQGRREITRPRWEGGVYFPGEYQPELWENGAYSIVMPGHDAHRQTVTMERLDDAGEVIGSQTMPREPKKGGVIWSREDVRAACGPMPKPAKAKRGKAAPIPVQAGAPEIRPQEPQESVSPPYPHSDSPEPVEALSEPEIATAEPLSIAQELPAEPVSNPDELPADPVAALLARVEALEAALAALPAVSTEAAADAPTVERAKRTPAHERAIRRAWAERRVRREAESGWRREMAITIETRELFWMEQDKRRRAVLNARATLSRLRADLAEAVASNAEWEALQHRTWTEAMGHKVKRRRAVHRAMALRRAAGIESARADTHAAQLAKAKDDLDAQRRAATYFDADTGAERLDHIGQSAHHARTAIERADMLQGRLDNAMRANAAMQSGIDAMEAELVAAVIRAGKAETALAAMQARLNGWPPAVRSVNVRFAPKAA